MKIHPLQFIEERPPTLTVDEPEVTTWRDLAGGEVVFCATYGAWHWLRVAGAGSYRFPVSSEGVVVAGQVVPERAASTVTVTDSYYRTIVPLALQVYGLETLHGSAVALPQGVVALCALPESGKSTIAFAMRERGHEVVADDAVVISPVALGDAAVRGTSALPAVQRVPFAVRLRQSSAEFFGSPSRDDVRITAPPVAGAAPSSTAGPTSSSTSSPTSSPTGQLPLAAVVKLERRHQDGATSVPVDSTAARSSSTPLTDSPEIELTRLPPNEAFSALLGEAKAFTLVDKERRRQMIANYLHLADVIPVYRLSYPTGLEHLDAICDRLEAIGMTPHAAVN